MDARRVCLCVCVKADKEPEAIYMGKLVASFA